MEAKITWMKGGVFIGECQGHSVLMEVPDNENTISAGPSPMDMMIIGAGGCTSYDVTQLLLETGVEITDCTVSIQAQTRDEDPQTINKLHVHYAITGRNIDGAKVQDAVDKSQQLYSAALISLTHIADITSEIEILDG